VSVTYLGVLDVVDICHRGRSELAHVLLFRQVRDETLSLVFSLGLREGELANGLLS